MLAVKAREKDLNLVCLIDPDVPQKLRGDAGRLRQVLTNLGGNAVKFTDAGEVAVHVSLVNETDLNTTIRLDVKDSGIGISAHKVPSLFSPFTQVDGSTTRRYGGTGLGLSISKQLAELMGGKIGVESEEGKGSTFWFTVVLEKVHAAVDSDGPDDLKRVQVLIADNHSANRAVLREILHSWGCRTGEAAGGQDAWEALQRAADRKDPYQIALLDNALPGEDIKSLGARIRADPVLGATRLILVTSLGDDGGDRLEEVGFVGAVMKPVRRQLLLDLMLASLHGSGSIAPDNRVTPTIEKRQPSGRILVVEDNITNQLVAVGMLEKLGYRADVAGNGLEALIALRSIPYGLVLMDCQMPEMDGFEATSRIRAGEAGQAHRSTPILAMTARAMQGDREKCLEAGMDDYLSKPIDMAALAAATAQWLSDEGIAETRGHESESFAE